MTGNGKWRWRVLSPRDGSFDPTREPANGELRLSRCLERGFVGTFVPVGKLWIKRRKAVCQRWNPEPTAARQPFMSGSCG